ncbi:MAG: AAA family ATPase [Melioribacteraceae bacterium]|nr:AAA family ATPase [Melioribacteraceae bacterium]
MKWITKLSIENYRAFTKKETIKIPFGNHLLIYGENGSGKSSVYNALKDFFTSSDKPAEKLTLNRFEQQGGNNSGTIEVEITDSSNPPNITRYKYAEPDTDSTHRNIPELLLANKVKGFLDYKGLLRTYFIESAAGQNPNLFDLLVEDLLADHKIKRISDFGSTEDELLRQWKLIKTPLQKKNYDGRKSICKTAKSYLPEFEVELNALLTNVFVEFKRFIAEYFDKKLEIGVKVSNIAFDKKTWEINRGVFLEIKYAGEEISSYQHFLNEARLSALASCLYLASISKFPIDPSFEIRPLFLDDVFIGLDTNNRIPLLKLLKKEFIEKHYQIFISTYDRQWFELARTWFNTERCPIKCMEIFIDGNEDPLIPDSPVFIDPSEDYYPRAKGYFNKKDYPAAANYLRKACERELRRILPQNQKLKANYQTGEIGKIQKLDELIRNFENYLSSNNINPNSFVHFITYKKIVFNPLSHDDIETPHYRKEIEDGIKLVENLIKIKTKVIVSVKDSSVKLLKMGCKDNVTSRMHIYQIILKENLQIIQEDTKPIRLSNVTCTIIENGIEQHFDSIYSAFYQIWVERNYCAPVYLMDFYKNIKVSNKKKLLDLMIF